jgi:hypothetical protein
MMRGDYGLRDFNVANKINKVPLNSLIDRWQLSCKWGLIERW